MEYIDYTVIMLSGGLDSTYLLFQQLRDTTSIIHIHHVQVRKCGGTQNQWRAENYTIPKIIKWMKNNFPNKRIEFTTSRFEYFNQYWPGWDTTYYTIIALEVAKSIYAQNIYSNIKIALGIEKNITRDPLLGQRVNEYMEVFNAITSRMVNKPQFIKPIVHLTKMDFIKDMPKELKNLTWSCRVPQKVGGEFIPCGRCHSCLELAFAEGRIDSVEMTPGGI